MMVVKKRKTIKKSSKKVCKPIRCSGCCCGSMGRTASNKTKASKVKKLKLLAKKGKAKKAGKKKRR